MTQTADLKSLRERVDAATGADREIDALIVRTLCPEAHVGLYVVGDDEPTVFHAQLLGIANKSELPHLTASIDASLALVEAKLPGRDIDLEIRETMADGKVLRVTDATIYPPAYSEGEQYFTAYGSSPALALLSALLAAVDEG